ncbi:hypothetical protein Daus18300_008137 [Diaporthe australafricana]|uniref:Heterokaryon incompatibility domain-containing protein n=1 Tax=Diaporthe australafricana TaxID=127596 RepID=A0ABR3WJT3_9PEZI
MQDDGPEREAEVMQMDGIYFNSKLNISAAEADVFKGLVFDRKPLLTNPCIIPVKVPESQVDMSLYVFHDKCSLGLWDNPLDKRGWVFQERILSPRIVHFTQDQVFWECRSFKASEVLPQGVSAPQLERLHKSRFDKSIGIASTAFNTQEIKSRWYELVAAYSGTSLSFADDRLLAISAMAKRCCAAMRVNPADYLAGMWKDDLPLSMIWLQEPISERSGPSENRPDLGIKHVPSWSWASTMAEITTMNLSPLTATAEVINVEVQRRSRNFFDGTDVCRLRLRGPLCKFRRHLQDGNYWIQISDDTTFQELDDFSFQTDGYISIYWDTARIFTADKYFLLHVATSEADEEPMEHGLVLLRTAECGTYKRVGSFVVPNTSDYSGSKLKDAFEGNFDTLSTEDYLEVNSDGKYVIDMV